MPSGETVCAQDAGPVCERAEVSDCSRLETTPVRTPGRVVAEDAAKPVPAEGESVPLK